MSIKDLLISFGNVADRLIQIAFPIATAVFLWGVIQYISASGDEQKISNGKKYIIYSIVVLFVMVAVWGIVKVLVDTFGFTNVQIPRP